MENKKELSSRILEMNFMKKKNINENNNNKNYLINDDNWILNIDNNNN